MMNYTSGCAPKNFHNNWDIQADEFKTVYDKSFYSKYGNNLWANPHWFPKAVMFKLIEFDKEKVSKMFYDPL